MTEKEYVTASEFLYGLVYDKYDDDDYPFTDCMQTLENINYKLIDKQFINKAELKDEFSDFEEWFNYKIESFKKDLPKSEIVQQALLIAIQDSLKEMILKLLEE